MKAKAEEEDRIREENKRIKEWEDKFDQEQKIKEEELIKKFYSDQSSTEVNNNDGGNLETVKNQSSDEENKK